MPESFSAKQLLPTLSSASSSSSSDHKLSNRSSCPGTFFHLFDWNCHLHRSRLFGSKLLPSGQPSSVPKDEICREERLPSPSMPLVAVIEDRGGFPPALETSMEDASQKKDWTPEMRKKRRSPNVVAKLMGLETMPSPEPCRRPRRPLDAQSPNLMRTPEEQYISNSRVLLLRQKTHELDRNIRGCSTRVESRRKDLLPDLSLKQGNENGAKNNKHNEDQVQPLISNPVIASGHEKTHVGSHEKGQVILPAPRSVAAARTSENTQEKMENKVTERKPPAARSLKIQCVSSNLCPADTMAQSCLKKDKELTRTQDAHPTSRPQRASRLVASKTSTSHVSAKEETVRQPLSCNRSAKKDKGHIKRYCSQQDLIFNNEEKVKPEVKRQEQACTRHSRTEMLSNQSSRLMKAKKKMDACPPKANSTSPESHDHQSDLSADSTITTVECDSGGSSTNSMSRHKRLSSSDKDSRDKIKVQKTGKKAHSSPHVKSLVMRTETAHTVQRARTSESTFSSKLATVRTPPPALTCNEDVLDDASDIAEECITECSSANQNYSSPSMKYSHEDVCSADNTYMMTLQDDSDAEESSVTFESGIRCNRSCGGGARGASGPSVEYTLRDNECSEGAAESSLNVNGIVESSCKSSIEDVGDTATSYENKHQKQPVSYSGKSTATILKELLMALNPSTKEFITEDIPLYDQSISCLNDAGVMKTLGNNFNGAQCLHHHAERTFDDEDFVHDTSKDLNSISQKGKHSLKECSDRCWQPSSNLALLLPSQYKLSMRSLGIQASEGCGEESCRDLIDCESAAHEILSSMPLQEHTSVFPNLQAKVTQSEENYVKHIVSRANLLPANIYSARLLLSGPLIEPALYCELEEKFQHQWKWGIQLDHDDDDNDDVCISNKFMGFHYDDDARVNRKLMFDCVGEALRLHMGINEQESQKDDMPFLHVSSPDPCSRHVQRQINDWRDMVCGINVDDMVEKEMNSGIGKWVDFPCDEYEIAVEVELSIFKDLIDELVLDLSTVFQKVPTRMSYKVERVGKTNKDKHFWVGL